MKIFDSNLIIYSSQEDFEYLKPIIKQPDSYFSEISRLEVLGYHKITIADKSYFESLFALINSISVDKSIIETAIDLRQKRKMGVGDSIIAATALLYDYELHTRNISDFNWIVGLKVINPII